MRTAAFALSAMVAISAVTHAVADRPSLREAMEGLKVPPAWFGTTTVHYSTTNPWAKARIEIRHLLSQGGQKAREGMKLTYLYKQKGDIGDGHEYPMYLFLGGETVWALGEYDRFIRERLKQGKADGMAHAFISCASCYAHFGEYANAEQVLQVAMHNLPKDQRWQTAREADVNAAMREVRLALLEADVNYKVVKDLVGRVKERAIGHEVMKSLTPAQQVVKIVNEELIATLGDAAPLDLSGGRLMSSCWWVCRVRARRPLRQNWR